MKRVNVSNLKACVAVHSLNRVRLLATLWTVAGRSPMSSAISRSLFKFMSIHSVMLSHPLLPLVLLPSVFPSIRVFSSEAAIRIRWPEYCNFSISPSSGYSGLISLSLLWPKCHLLGWVWNPELSQVVCKLLSALIHDTHEETL